LHPIKFPLQFTDKINNFLYRFGKAFLLWMDITFKTSKLKKIFNSEKELLRHYGVDNSKRIMLRMQVLFAAPNLSEVPKEKPERCHDLQGNKKGQIAVDLNHPFRLVFCPNHNPLPLTEEGNLDETKVTCIKILAVEDYH